MFAIGDIVQIFAPQAGHNKFHLCILVGVDGSASQFVYLNSNPTFDQTCVVDCKRIPCLPASATGKIAFSFAILPRYNDRQLRLYKAKKVGELDQKLATELHEFVRTVTTLNSTDRQIVLAALAQIAKL
jgi:hypothetical protein